jgi:hypothetical protein
VLRRGVHIGTVAFGREMGMVRGVGSREVVGWKFGGGGWVEWEREERGRRR